MLTPETLTVLLVGVGANALLALAIGIHRLADRRRQRAVARAFAAGGAGVTSASASSTGATGASAGAAGASGRTIAGGDAATPWFPSVVDLSPQVASASHTTATPGGDLGLANASAWSAWLEEEAARVARYHRPATIVLVELSGLDRLAERVGPAAADRLVPPVAATMVRHARAADHLAQLGPARFGVMLVETDEVRAINYVERIRTACDLWLAAGAVALRLSIGWAEIKGDGTGEAAFAEAERRLFGERRRTEPVIEAAPSDERETFPTVLQASRT